MGHFVNFNQTVTGFSVGEKAIDCMCGKEMIKTDKSGNVLFRKEIFEKDGLSRNLVADDNQIFLFDFCTLFIVNRESYDLLGKWELGVDLSSDIVGITFDENTVFCSVRNGKIVTLDRRSHEIKEFAVSQSSMWSIQTYGKYLICGTVDGKLLLLDKATLSVEKRLDLGQKNIRSFLIDGDIFYVSSQSGTLFKIDFTAFEVSLSRKNAHKKMFDCVGIYRDTIITVSHPCSELSFWDKETLEKRKTLNIPLQLSGRGYIENDYLYLTSRNLLGIERIELNEFENNV